MRSQHIPLCLLLLSSITGVFSVPLGLTHDAPADDAEKGTLANLNTATVEANRQIDIMEKVIADPENEKHAPLIQAAFGKNADLNVVKENIQKLKHGNVPVQLPTAEGKNTLAYTFYDNTKDPMVPQHVAFGQQFHKSSPAAQAGTLIHEGTHFLGDTGDYIDKNKKIIPGSKDEETKKTGYTSKMEPYTSVEALQKDKAFTKMRDSTTDMHNNAESYTQFASLCANAGLRRREFHMYRRALADGDHEMAAHYLVRRQSCALPKDYFKNKLAAKNAAGAKTAVAGDKKAASKLATTSKALSGLTAGAKKSALTPGSKKSALTPGSKKSALTPGSKKSALTAGAKNSKLATTAKGRPTAGKKSALTPGAKKSALTGKKPSSKLPTSKKPVTAKSLTKGAARTGAKKVAGARTSGSKSLTKEAGTKKAAGAKSLTKGANRAVPKKAAGSRTTKGAGTKKAAGAKSLTKGANRAGSKKVTGARATKGAASKKAVGAKSSTKGANRAGAKNTGARKPTSKVAGKSASKSIVKGAAGKSSTKGANRAGAKNAGTRKPTSKVAGKAASKSLVKGAAGAKKVTSARKPTSKVPPPTGGAKKVAGAAAKSAPKKSTVSAGKGALKSVATPQNLKKAATLTATVASKAGKKK